MTDFVAVEDMDNVQQILVHHLGHPWAKDDDGKPVGALDEAAFTALERDLLRYCTRLRCQPQTEEHVDGAGYTVPKHRLVT